MSANFYFCIWLNSNVKNWEDLRETEKAMEMQGDNTIKIDMSGKNAYVLQSTQMQF